MLKKFFSKIDHLHLIDVVDIATGVPYDAGIPLTGFKYRCVLCGREYMLTTESGLKQIAEGHSVKKVLQWMEERPTLHAPDAANAAVESE